MIHDYTAMNVGQLHIEVNWSASVTPCKVIRVTMTDERGGDPRVAHIEREDLYAMLMLFGDEKQQEELIPVQHAEVRAITRMLRITAKKDIRKGETINFPYTYYVPSGIYERLLSGKDYSAALSTPDLEKIVRKR